METSYLTWFVQWAFVLKVCEGLYFSQSRHGCAGNTFSSYLFWLYSINTGCAGWYCFLFITKCLTLTLTLTPKAVWIPKGAICDKPFSCIKYRATRDIAPLRPIFQFFCFGNLHCFAWLLCLIAFTLRFFLSFFSEYFFPSLTFWGY